MRQTHVGVAHVAGQDGIDGVVRERGRECGSSALLAVRATLIHLSRVHPHFRPEGWRGLAVSARPETESLRKWGGEGQMRGDAWVGVFWRGG